MINTNKAVYAYSRGKIFLVKEDGCSFNLASENFIRNIHSRLDEENSEKLRKGLMHMCEWLTSLGNRK